LKAAEGHRYSLDCAAPESEDPELPDAPDDAPVEADDGAALLQSAGLSETGHCASPPRPTALSSELAALDASFIGFFFSAMAGPARIRAARKAPKIAFFIVVSSTV
jgi:hypothetical protein